MTILLAALLVASEPAVATQQAEAPAPATAPAPAAKPVKEKMICKVDDTDSYSRLRKRECHTQSEWDRLAGGVSTNDLKNMGAR